MPMEINSKAISWGIHSELSDWRCHICPGFRWRDRGIFCFTTEAGRWAVEQERAVGSELRTANQTGVGGPTGWGYLVMSQDIPGCLGINPPSYVWESAGFGIKENTSSKGRKAENLFRCLLDEGFVSSDIPFQTPDSWEYVGSSRRDYDFVLTKLDVRYRVEVKCDFLGTTRGLFLQTAERNPLGAY